jgi:hypothetical protein
MKIRVLITTFGIMMSFCSFSQVKATTEEGKQVLLNENGTWAYTGTGESPKLNIPDFDDKSFYWKNGYDKIVSVKFQNLMPKPITLDKAIFKSMVMDCMTKAKYKLKNKLSYVPVDLSIMKRETDEYVMIIKYLGKNAYGAESKESSYFTYDDKGEYKSSF